MKNVRDSYNRRLGEEDIINEEKRMGMYMMLAMGGDQNMDANSIQAKIAARGLNMEAVNR